MVFIIGTLFKDKDEMLQLMDVWWNPQFPGYSELSVALDQGGMHWFEKEICILLKG